MSKKETPQKEHSLDKYLDDVSCKYCKKVLSTTKNKIKHENTCKKRPTLTQEKVKSNNDETESDHDVSDEKKSPEITKIDDKKKHKKRNKKEPKENKKETIEEKEIIDNDLPIIKEQLIEQQIEKQSNELISNHLCDLISKYSITVIEKTLIWIVVPYLLFDKFFS